MIESTKNTTILLYLCIAMVLGFAMDAPARIKYNTLSHTNAGNNTIDLYDFTLSSPDETPAVCTDTYASTDIPVTIPSNSVATVFSDLVIPDSGIITDINITRS